MGTSSKSKPTSLRACRACTWSVCPTQRYRSPATGFGRLSPTAVTAGRRPGSHSPCHRRHCRKWDRSTTLPWHRRCCRRSESGRGIGWRRPCCSVSCRWTVECGRCAACCRPYWPPNGTAGLPSWCRRVIWRRPAWSTGSTSGAFAPWDSCRPGSTGLAAWTTGSPRWAMNRRLPRTWPTWWASPRRVSRSRWRPQGRIT